MNSIVYVLVIICSHGADNSQLLVDAFPHQTLERCQVTETVVKKEMTKDCNQLAVQCMKKEIIK